MTNPGDNGRHPSAVFLPPRGLLDPRLRVTVLLILINSLTLMVCVTLSIPPGHPTEALARVLGSGLTSTLFKAGAFADFLIESGQYWRLLTSLFLHAGVIHLLLNMLALAYLAIWTEPLLGRTRFLIVYLVSGVTGSLFGYGVNLIVSLPQFGGEPSIRFSVGASGAIFGVAGALIASGWVARGSLRTLMQAPHSRRLVNTIVLMLMLGLFFPWIDGWSHVGGFLAGLILGLFFFSRLSVAPRAKLCAVSFQAVCALAAGCAALLALSAYPNRPPSERDDAVVAVLSEEVGRPDVALAWVNRRMAASGEDFVWTRHLVSLLLSTRQYGAALVKTDAALVQKRDDPQIRYYRGVILWRLGNLERAATELALAEGIAKSERAEHLKRPERTLTAKQAYSPSPTQTAETARSKRTPTFEPAVTPSSTETTETTRTETQPSATTALSTGELPAWVDVAEMSRAVILRQMGREDESAVARDALAARLAAEADAATSAADALKAQGAGTSIFGVSSDTGQEMQRYRLTAAIKKNHLAWMYAVLDTNLDEGLRLVEEAIAILPTAAFVDTRGWLFYKKKEYRAALDDLLLASRADTAASAEITYHIGATYAALGDYPAAKRYLEQSLEMNQDFDAIDDARKLLEDLGPHSDSPPKRRDFAAVRIPSRRQ